MTSPHRWALVERIPGRFDGRRMVYAERINSRHKTEQAAKDAYQRASGWAGFSCYVRRLSPKERSHD